MILALKLNQTNLLAKRDRLRVIALAEVWRSDLIFASHHHRDRDLIRHAVDLLDGRERFELPAESGVLRELKHVFPPLLNVTRAGHQ